MTRAGRFLGRERSLRDLARWVSRHRVAALIALGAALRVAQYADGRSYWMDESSLLGNLTGRDLAGLFGPLRATQLAPPGFLVVEWAAVRAFGPSTWSTRLFPLLCGVAALPMAAAVARRALRPRAVWIAVALFALSDELIYFSAELKQYGVDVLAALGCLWLGLRAAEAPTRGRMLAAGGGGVAAVWFSHPSAFVLAGVGLALGGEGLARRGWRGAVGPASLAAAWLVSFAAVYAIGQEQIGHRRDLWAFWAFAFPPWPPANLRDVAWPLQRFAYLFVNPLEFGSWLAPAASTALPVALYVAGCAALGRRDRPALAMLALPILAALAAAYLRLYPFHGRLVLFLVPALLLPIAEGASRLDSGPSGRRLPLWVYRVALAALFAPQVAWALYHLDAARDRRELNPRGDRRPWRLDPGTFPSEARWVPPGTIGVDRPRPGDL